MTSFGLFLLCLSLVVSVSSSNEVFVHMSILAGRQLSAVYTTVTEEDYRKCCLWCVQDDRCVSTNHHPGSSTCQLSDVAGVLSLPSSGWTVITKTTSDDWQMVFRVTPYIGTDAYSAWVNGDDVTDDAGCTDLASSCAQHYRHPVVDSWSTLPITKVKYALYKDGQEAAFVIFDGTNSMSNTDWFSSDRILDSSWSDLQAGPFNHFSIEGELDRHFYINVLYSGCPGDIGYTVLQTGAAGPCNFDNHPVYPVILYASGSTRVVMESSDLVAADFAAIFVLL